MKTKSFKANHSGAAEGPRIICGTDFSENARQASRAAAAIAKRLNEPLLLVHALDFPGYAAKGKVAGEFKLLKASRRKSLQQEAESNCHAGATVDVQLPTGRPDEVLVELACKGPTRFVVVASLGRRGAERWFLGSVAERTAERATVPTLVVRDATPFEAWTLGERPLKVFVAFNLTFTSEAALRWVKELQAIGPCEVVVGYVNWPPEERARLGGPAPLPLVGNPPDVQAILERDARARVINVLGEIPFRLRVEANWGRPETRLAEMAKEEGADLLVVGSHQYHGFKRLWHVSVSRGLLHNAPMSVALVPTPPELRRSAQIIPQVRRVLASTDFSELSDRSIPHAYAALPQGGVVKLIHVIPPWELPGPLVPHYQPKRLTKKQHLQLAADCARKLRSLAPPEADARGITTEVEVLQHRDAAEAICEASERFGADRICLGSHGRSGLSKALLGSVAQKVMARSTRPLLVVRPPSD